MRTRKKELVSDELKPFVGKLIRENRIKYNYSLEDLSNALNHQKNRFFRTSSFFIHQKTDFISYSYWWNYVIYPFCGYNWTNSLLWKRIISQKETDFDDGNSAHWQFSN